MTEATCTSTDPTNHQGDTCPVHELVTAIEKLYSYIDYGKFVNERTDDADFVDAVLEQVGE